MSKYQKEHLVSGKMMRRVFEMALENLQQMPDLTRDEVHFMNQLESIMYDHYKNDRLLDSVMIQLTIIE